MIDSRGLQLDLLAIASATDCPICTDRGVSRTMSERRTITRR
jgi:hypothetical protein